MHDKLKSVKRTLRNALDYFPGLLKQRSRKAELSSERKHYSVNDILQDVDQMPIPDGAAVLVHSSLKSIGFVEGGPQAVVEALIKSVVDNRGGTLMFPTYSISGTMHNTLVEGYADGSGKFDVSKTPSNLGAIPEAFRNWPGVIRSVHPTHSFTALGPLAEELVATHHTCGTSFGRGSPMANLLNHDSWLLGLGTNLGNVTLYHCLEEIEDDFPFDVYTSDSPLPATCIDWENKEHHLSFSTHSTSVSKTRIDRPENSVIREFFTSQFEERAGLSWHQVCEARTWLVGVDKFYAESARLMREGVTIYTTESELRDGGFL